MTKKELLKIVFDSYPNETVGAVFEDCFDGETIKDDLDFLGDSLLGFLMREVWESVDDEDPEIMLNAAILTTERAYNDVESVLTGLRSVDLTPKSPPPL